jgi:hypothetical protein
MTYLKVGSKIKEVSNCLSKICGLFSHEETIYLDKYFNSSDWDLSSHLPLKKRKRIRKTC